jgi:serine/threonine-protein kinase
MLARGTLPIELDAGTRVGPYAVESVRARLPHLVVHRARHVVTERTVALQVLRPTPRAPSTKVLTRHLAVLNRLRHAHIAELLGSGELPDGRPFIVVEWVAGRSLQTLLEQCRVLPLSDLLAIAEQVAGALAAAHALGVVHGELHARNVGLVSHGPHRAVKVVSFGMWPLSGATLAPEQRAGVCDRKSDVYAFGRLLYQMATGQPPPSEPMPPSVVADVPSGFDDVVLRCLRADPARRYGGVETMMQDLRSAVASSELVAELHVSAFIDPDVDTVEAEALDDIESTLQLAQRWLEEQNVAQVLGGGGAVVARARIPRTLDEQRAARAGWVRLANAVQSRIQSRPRKHPAVRTRVSIRIDR